MAEAVLPRNGIAQGVASVEHLDSIEHAEIHAFGQASDMSAFGPNAHLTAIINGWGPYYVKRVQQALDGTWKGGEQTFDGIGDGMVVRHWLWQCMPIC